ncbi:MAG: biopolymer transporter ExbD [Pseudomonadota bacterium]
MDLSEPPKRRRTESIVPMINVVFLLLIFFLMTSQLATPQPFDVTPPEASTESDAEAEPVLFVNESGRMSIDGEEGDAALASLTARSDETTVIQLHADANLEAVQLARILRDLGEAGLSQVELVVSPK